MDSTESSFDVIIVGTGFSSTFFLLKFRELFGHEKRILVLDRGKERSHAEMMKKGDWTDIKSDQLYVDRSGGKKWAVKPSFGGNSNYWIGNTPRFLPSDFRTHSLYGIGSDWPIDYNDLEPDYTEAEYLMSIAGPDVPPSIYPRSRPYPQPPHKLSDPDKYLKKAHPTTFFALPSARARVATANRTACCATAECMFCPVDAKFRVVNELGNLYKSENITLRTDAQVTHIDTHQNAAKGLTYVQDGREYQATADLIVLGANPIFNAAILLRSGLDDGQVGKGLMDHPTYFATCLLDGVDNFQGSTSETGIGYSLYDGDHRKEHAGCLFFTSNAPTLRPEYGRWRQMLRLEIPFEDVPSNDNYVSLDPDTSMPVVHYARHSEYTQRGRDTLLTRLEGALSGLPIEDIQISETPSSAGAAHIMGTHRMGSSPENSVVDANVRHHRYQNLVLLGGGNFVTPSAVNPTLTISALALRAAKKL